MGPILNQSRGDGQTRSESLFSNVTAAFLLIAAATCYILVAELPGSPDVPDYWLRWMREIRVDGLAVAYSKAQSDYPVGSFTLFSLANRLNLYLRWTDLALLKTCVVTGAFFGATVFGFWSRSLWKTIFFLFAIMLNSAALGYLDALYLPFLLLSLMALERKAILLTGVFYAIAVSMKWHPLVIAPFLIVQVCDLKLGNILKVRQWLPAACKFGIGAIPVILPQIIFFDIHAITFSITTALSHHALSFQGLNGNWIIQLILYFNQGSHLPAYYDAAVPPSLTTTVRAIFWAVYAFLWTVYFLRRSSFKDFVWFSCLGFYSYYALNLGVHENHLFIPAVLAFALLGINGANALPMTVFLNLAANLNLVLFYGLDGRWRFVSSISIGCSIVVAALNMGFLVLCLGQVANVFTSSRKRPEYFTPLQSPAPATKSTA